MQPGAQPSNLPVDWEERLDPASGRYFYYNKVTKVTQWEKPITLQPPPPKPQGPSGQTAPPPPGPGKGMAAGTSPSLGAPGQAKGTGTSEELITASVFGIYINQEGKVFCGLMNERTTYYILTDGQTGVYLSYDEADGQRFYVLQRQQSRLRP